MNNNYIKCNSHLVNMTKCISKKSDYGKIEYFDFVHPLCFVTRDDSIFAAIYPEYLNAFVTFKIYKN